MSCQRDSCDLNRRATTRCKVVVDGAMDGIGVFVKKTIGVNEIIALLNNPPSDCPEARTPSASESQSSHHRQIRGPVDTRY